MRKRDLFFGTLFLLAAWQALSWLVSSGVLPIRARSNILPGPLEVFPIFFAELPGYLGGHFVVSLWRVLASMVLAVLLAVPAGLVMGQSRFMNRLFSPLVYLTYPVPKVVLVPVVVLFFGVGDLAKIIVITLILFFQILVLVRDAAAGLRAEQRLTTVVVTHYIEEAAFLGQKILLFGQTTEVIANPGAGTLAYRDTPAYQAMIQHLRARLGALSDLNPATRAPAEAARA